MSEQIKIAELEEVTGKLMLALYDLVEHDKYLIRSGVGRHCVELDRAVALLKQFRVGPKRRMHIHRSIQLSDRNPPPY